MGMYEGEMMDGQPHGMGTIIYLSNDKFGRENYTGGSSHWQYRQNLCLKFFLCRRVEVWDDHRGGRDGMEERGPLCRADTHEPHGRPRKFLLAEWRPIFWRIYQWQVNLTASSSKLTSILNIFYRRNGLGDMKYGDGDSYKASLLTLKLSTIQFWFGVKYVTCDVKGAWRNGQYHGQGEYQW